MDPALGPSGWIKAGLGQKAWLNEDYPFPPVRDTDVKSPADLYAIGDSRVSIFGEVSGITDCNSFGNYPIDKPPHREFFSVVIADGHTESVKTNVFFGTNGLLTARWNNDNLP
jgi:hypothetical protein